MPPQIEPVQYVVTGGAVGAFALIAKLLLRTQKSVTDAAFNRIDRLEEDLKAERQRCDTLEAESRRMGAQIWALEYKIAALQRANEGGH